MEEARAFAAAGPEAVQAVKADLVASAVAKIDATADAKRARFLDHWFGAEARARLGALREGLLAKQGAKAGGSATLAGAPMILDDPKSVVVRGQRVTVGVRRGALGWAWRSSPARVYVGGRVLVEQW